MTFRSWAGPLAGRSASSSASTIRDIAAELILLASASTRGYPFFGSNEQGLPDPANRLKTLEEVKRDHGRTIPVQGGL